MSINVYATNTPDDGFDFGGSWESLEAAQQCAERMGLSFTHWWDDEDRASEQPEWARYPNC